VTKPARQSRLPAARPRSASWRLVPAAVIVCAGIGAYANSVRGAFVLDDLDAVVRNFSIRSLATALAPPANTTVAGRPFLNLTLALSYAVGGLDPIAFHVGNVAVHVAAALLLFGLLWRTLSLPVFDADGHATARGTALATAVLWVVHPITTASVTYTVQRAESLMGMLFLLTLYAVLRSATSQRSGWWRVLAVAACALGMGTKEAMAAAPLAALAFDRTFLSGSFAAAWKRRGGLYVALAATWSLLVASVVSSGGRGESVTMSSAVLSPLHYAMTQCEWLVRYARLVLWPHPLVFDYGFPDAGVTILRTFSAWAPWGAAVGVMIAATVVAGRRRPALAFVVLVAAAILAPSSSVLPIVTEVAAEHRMYLPSAALVLLVVLAAGALLRKAGVVPTSPRWRWWIRSAVAVVAAVLAALTVLRNRDYRSAEVLWRDTVSKRPGNARAHVNLGLELLARGDLAGAMASFERAVTIKPDFAEGWTNQGLMFAKLGQIDRAIATYDHALQVQPDFQPAFYNRALAWIAKGELDRAVADFTKASELNPFDPDPLVGRGMVKGRSGDLSGAIADLSRAIAVAPYSPDAYVNRAAAYYEMKDFVRAAHDLEMASRLGARLDPRFVDAVAKSLQPAR
jgi:tetratricopeptide (TPR) repeat protein